MTGGAPEPEHISVFRRLKAALGDPSKQSRDARRRAAARAADPAAQPFGTGRDPRGMAAVLDDLTRSLGWDSPLARAQLVSEWADLVGTDNAAHSQPVGVEGTELFIRSDSSAWAQQLRGMRSAILVRITERHPAAGIETIRVTGPDAPTWKRGPRSVPGRGPRDTYG